MASALDRRNMQFVLQGDGPITSPIPETTIVAEMYPSFQLKKRMDPHQTSSDEAFLQIQLYLQYIVPNNR